jgi:hypothetical protein
MSRPARPPPPDQLPGNRSSRVPGIHSHGHLGRGMPRQGLRLLYCGSRLDHENVRQSYRVKVRLAPYGFLGMPRVPGLHRVGPGGYTGRRGSRGGHGAIYEPCGHKDPGDTQRWQPVQVLHELGGKRLKVARFLVHAASVRP